MGTGIDGGGKGVAMWLKVPWRRCIWLHRGIAFKVEEAEVAVVVKAVKESGTYERRLGVLHIQRQG